MNTKPTLESVVSDFHQWRQNKTSPRNRIPEELKQKAVTLLMDMSSGKIIKALGISSTMLKSWSGANTKNNASTATIDFVSLPVEPQPAINNNNDFTLNFTQPNGNHWCLQGDINVAQLNTFISAVNAIPGGVQ